MKVMNMPNTQRPSKSVPASAGRTPMPIAVRTPTVAPAIKPMGMPKKPRFIK